MTDTTKVLPKGKLPHTEGCGSSAGLREGIGEVVFELILKLDFDILNGTSIAQK